VLRIGLTPDPKIPDSVRLDKVVDCKARGLSAEIARLEAEAKPLADRRAIYRAQISEWDKLSEFTTRLNSSRETIKQHEAKILQSESALRTYKELLKQRRAEFERAQRAWFRRTTKVERAARALREGESQLQKVEANHTLLQNQVNKTVRLAKDTEAALLSQQVVCKKLSPRPIIEGELSTLALKLNPLEERIRSLQDDISQLEQKTIAEARAIFCTLTKSYTGKELDGQVFNAVIVDEISMALPPLIFLAAGRGKEGDVGSKTT
jgi:chromosome segregation ATPase